MFPILIDFGRHELPWFGEQHLFLPTYGFLFAAAVVLAWVWFTRRARSLGIPEERLFNLLFYSVIAGILGAKLLLIALAGRYYLENPVRLLWTLRSAGVLMGGVALGAVTFILYCRRHKLPLWELGDAIAAPLALAQAVGRLGCFSAGCCWGVHVDPANPIAVVFRDPQAQAQTGVELGVPLFPTQLIEMAFDLLLAAVLAVMWRRRLRPAGTVFWLYVLLYSTGRGILEFWRGDTERGLFLGGAVSTSQLISIAAILLSLTILVRGTLRGRAADAAAS